MAQPPHGRSRRARSSRAGCRPSGFLGPTTPAAQPEWTAGFVPRLRELGWVEGSTVVIESRWAEGRSERFAEIAAEFVRLKVDTIVTSGAVAVLAAKAVTTVVPIIFVGAGDPVGNGLVASLARPGGNVTGQSVQQPDSAGKRLELLREVLPDLRSLAIMTKVDAPASVRETDELRSMASALGLQVIVIEIRRAEDIAPGFARTHGSPAGALRGDRTATDCQQNSDQYVRARRTTGDDVHLP